MAKQEFRFSTKKELMMLPVPTAKPMVTYSHLTQKGFGVRVMKADLRGNVLRTYIHRFNEYIPDGQGVITKYQRNETLGPVEPREKGDVALKFDEALRLVLEKRKTLRDDKAGDSGQRLTVGGAWAHYGTEKRSNRADTKQTDSERYNRYLAHLQNRYLDELPYSFWNNFAKSLEEGTLLVGQRLDKNDNIVPALLGPLKTATLGGVLSTAGLLYDIANKYKGLKGVADGFNPALQAKGILPRPNKKISHIKLKDLGAAWRASDQLIAPWWRDMFRVFVLTGLRRSLLIDMRYDEIDFERGLYIIDPRRRGTKRRGDKITTSTPDIRLPLSQFVLTIIKAKREFAPDKEGLVWHTPKPSRGRRVKDDKQSLSDPRYAWTLIESAIGGVHFSPQDLRRTFASVAGASDADIFATSMLMLHTGTVLADAAQVPGITIEYVDTDEAVDRKRRAAEIITAYVLNLASRTAEDTANIPEPVLHPAIEEALKEIV